MSFTNIAPESKPVPMSLWQRWALAAERDGMPPLGWSLAGGAMALLAAFLLITFDAPYNFAGAAICCALRWACSRLQKHAPTIKSRSHRTLTWVNRETIDHASESLFLIVVGYVTNDVWMGWACAWAVMMATQARLMGLVFRQTPRDVGPLGHGVRWILLILGCLGALISAIGWPHARMPWPHAILFLTEGLIGVGALVTAIRRWWWVLKLQNVS